MNDDIVFANRYRIPSTRLQNWNYSKNGYYYVTICTKNRECYLGNIVVKTQNIASLHDKTCNQNKFGPQSNNLASIIRGFKIGVNKLVKNIGEQFGWQSRYYDHVIRNEKSLRYIQQYIINNPKNWETENLF